MLSEPRVSKAIAALAQPIAEFRSAVQGALTQADAFLAEQTADAPARAERAAAELGVFAVDRVNPAQFAALFRPPGRADAAATAALRRAVETLRAIAARGEELFVVDAPPRSALGAVVGDALADAGRAFGAVMLAELVRAGRYRSGEHDGLLDAFAFRAWNRSERRSAPPLVVTVDGSDLHAGALTDFADGREKIVALVRGACGPAPLARCITPGTFVLQTADETGLERVAAFDGPAIAAVVPEGAALFSHDPAAGRESWQRLTVSHLPSEAPRKGIGGVSAWQMGEDLRLLADLARTPFAVPVAGGASAPAMGANDAVDRIAGWLLGQSGLGGTLGEDTGAPR